MNTLSLSPEQLLQEAIDKSRELLGASRPDMARDIAAQILRCAPGHPDALEIIGLAHHQKREYEQAINYLRQASEAAPNNPDFLNNLALPLSVTGQIEEAVTLLERAVELGSPTTTAQYMTNLALQYRGLGKNEAAIRMFYQSLDKADLAMTWVNLGGTYGETHQLEAAINCFKKAIAIEPDNAMAHTDLAYSYHLKGDWIKGWEEYEWRFQSFPQLRPYLEKYDQNLRWDGKSSPGSRIMFYCEQGLGDAVQFVRYIPEFKRRHPNCHVILHCAESLVSLFKQSNLGIDEYFSIPVSAMTWVPPHDYHASVMSLPFLLGINDIRSTPYLSSEIHDMGYADKCRIGICWAGSPLHPNDRIRSCALRCFQTIHDLPGVKLFSFCDPRQRQYLTGETIDFAAGAEGMQVVDCVEHMTDFSRTASMLRSMTAVVTVDTAVMHLSAALGVPTIGLLAYNSDWRWGQKDEITPWYQNLILMRQPSPGDWESVFRRLTVLIEVHNKMREKRNDQNLLSDQRSELS